MTEFLGDFSHYDDYITPTVAARMKAEGLAAVSHKVTEGMGGYDEEAALAFASWRQVGFDLIGAYGVVRSGDGAAQARVLISQCDRIAPWWRDMPGWWWQVDLERWPYDSVSPQDGREYADELARTGKKVVVYASKTQYGDSLRGWPYAIWNANYPSSRLAYWRDLYPGDNGPGWVSYSGQMPAFWQFASSATIAGLSTSDISAFRGTRTQLYALLASGHLAALTDDSKEAAMFLAVDDKNNYYLCNGLVSRPVSLADAQIIAYGKASGFGPTYPDLLTGDTVRNLINQPGKFEWVDLPKLGGGVYPRYVRSGWGTWAGALPAVQPAASGVPGVSQADLVAALKAALTDSAVLAAITKAEGDDLARRLAG
jgi:hypothetical protein